MDAYGRDPMDPVQPPMPQTYQSPYAIRRISFGTPHFPAPAVSNSYAQGFDRLYQPMSYGQDHNLGPRGLYSERDPQFRQPTSMDYRIPRNSAETMASPSHNTPTRLRLLVPLFFETNPPRTSQANSYFFRMPQELRDQIYDILLDRKMIALGLGPVNQEDWVMHFDYGPSQSGVRHPNKLSWLLACKQLLSEGLERFYAKATLKGREWLMLPPIPEDPSPFRLVILHRMHRLNLTLGLAESDPNGTVTLVFNDAHCPRRLGQCLEGRQHHIKDLKFQFDKLNIEYLAQTYPYAKEWAVDSSSFECIGSSFERVEFCTPICELVRNDSGSISREMTSKIYPKLQAELEWVGKRLVGAIQDRHDCDVRDWIERFTFNERDSVSVSYGGNLEFWRGREYALWHVEVRKSKKSKEI